MASDVVHVAWPPTEPLPGSCSRGTARVTKMNRCCIGDHPDHRLRHLGCIVRAVLCVIYYLHTPAICTEYRACAAWLLQQSIRCAHRRLYAVARPRFASCTHRARVYSTCRGARFHDQSIHPSTCVGCCSADELSELLRPVGASRHPGRSSA